MLSPDSGVWSTLKSPYILAFAAFYGNEFGRSDVVLFEFVSEQSEREIAAVDLNVFESVFYEIGHASDMVFVSVREHYALYLVDIFVDI